MFGNFGGKRISFQLSTRILRLGDKTDLLVVLNRSRLANKELTLTLGKVYAFSGRVTVEGPGVYSILRAGPDLTQSTA